MSKTGTKTLVKKDALDRAHEMMDIPIKDLPDLAVEFCRYHYKEKLLLIFAVYAQCIEKLPCKDDRYKATKEDREWFKERIR